MIKAYTMPTMPQILMPLVLTAIPLMTNRVRVTIRPNSIWKLIRSMLAIQKSNPRNKATKPAIPKIICRIRVVIITKNLPVLDVI
jgi:hypothetical protein